MKRRITKRPEEDLQLAVAAYLDTCLPQGAVWFHVPNQRGGRSITENKILKGMGVKSGMPDCVLLYHGRTYFIELKPWAYRNRKNGGLSPAQIECHRLLKVAGFQVTTCYSVEQVEGTVRAWMPTRGRIAA